MDSPEATSKQAQETSLGELQPIPEDRVTTPAVLESPLNENKSSPDKF